MTVAGETRTVPVPLEAWAIGWAFLIGQVVSVARSGFQDESAWPLSILFGVAVVTFFAHGVLRARMVRVVLVVVVMALSGVFQLVALVIAPAGWDLVGLLLTVGQGWCLWRFFQTDWWAWQRTRPSVHPSLAGPLLLAVAVGVLAGLLGTDTTSIHAEVNL